MLFNVPQYIDVEDKVAGPLTVKQLVWMIVLAVAVLIIWKLFPPVIAIPFILPIALFFLALAFYRPYGQPFGNFVFHGIMFLFKPKMYVWKRESQSMNIPHHKPQAVTQNMTQKNKEVLLENIDSLAQIVDTEGQEKNERLMEILKRQKQNCTNNNL